MLSAAAVNRRERSSRLSRKAMNRRLIPARSFTSSAYAKTFDIGNVILLQALRQSDEPGGQVKSRLSQWKRQLISFAYGAL
jgi:hypothetical protein